VGLRVIQEILPVSRVDTTTSC